MFGSGELDSDLGEEGGGGGLDAGEEGGGGGLDAGEEGGVIYI